MIDFQPANARPPAAKKVMVLSPHPDDEAMGLGGTIALYASMGTEVCLVVLSNGEKVMHNAESVPDIAEIRKQEALKAAGILGVKEVHFLEFPDGELLSFKDKINEKVEDIAKRFNPEIVFSTSPAELHEDHRVVSCVAMNLFERVAGIKKLMFYEVYGNFRFNSLVDITDVMHIKRDAVFSYSQSLLGKPDICFEAVNGLNRSKALYTLQMRYYEAFWEIKKPMSEAEMLRWLSYGMVAEDPAAMLLKELKAVDELLFEVRKQGDLLKVKEVEISSLKSALDRKTIEAGELTKMLDTISGSLPWRLATKYYGLRDKVLPLGSKRRSFYDRITRYIKSAK